MEKTRAEHLAWCKRRALEYVEDGDLPNAIASMGSDLSKHPETKCDPHLVLAGAMDAQNGDAQAVRRWINGFN
jgi:hypothetical protein